MSGVRAYKITEHFVNEVAKFIRAGGFPATASEAAGVPAAVFDDWLRRAERARRNSLFRKLRDDVRIAAAQARLTAEIEVFKKKQVDWLLHGPGKDTSATPGWSQPPRSVERAAEAVDAADSPTIHRLFCLLAKKMEAFPDALRVLVECLRDCAIPIRGLRKRLRIVTPEEDVPPESP